MAVYFLDTSAIVKRYAAETGSHTVLKLTDLSAGHEIYIAGISRVEVIAAIKGKERAGGITASDAAYAIRQFKAHVSGQYRIVDISSAIIRNATVIAENRVVKGYDAVQIAAAEAINDRLMKAGLPTLAFVCSDKQMITACQDEGLAVLDPETASP
jgi:hypothetical protein